MSKTKIYECAHFEYEYDDFGKYAWCHNCDSGHSECPSDYIYGMQFCPFYRQGKLRAEREVTEYEKACALKFKSKMEAKLHERQNEAVEVLMRLNKYKKS